MRRIASFQRLHRLGQILRLRIQISFAFLRRLQFLQRRQIHRTQRLNAGVQAVQFILQRGRFGIPPSSRGNNAASSTPCNCSAHCS